MKMLSLCLHYVKGSEILATIHDVAREAGVSIATVSRVLQNSPKVLPKTKDRVNDAIKKLNYSPNRLARQFRIQATGNIVVIIPEIGNTFYDDILRGIEHVAELNSYYNVLIVNSHGDPATERRYFEFLSQKLIDGIITFSVSLPLDEITRYAEQYPVVIACRYFDNSNLHNITIDNEKASRDITNYILSLNHKRICYLAGPSSILVYRDRLNGYMHALTERGLPIDMNLILTCNNVGIESGYNAVNSLLSSRLPFSAIIAGGDTLAIGAIRSLSNNGYRIPDDVAVVGFDDIPLSSLINPTLTTVRQPQNLIGVRSAEMLFDLIAGKTPPNNSIVLNYELIIRESSGGFFKEQ